MSGSSKVVLRSQGTQETAEDLSDHSSVTQQFD